MNFSRSKVMNFFYTLLIPRLNRKGAYPHENTKGEKGGVKKAEGKFHFRKIKNERGAICIFFSKWVFCVCFFNFIKMSALSSND